MAIDDSICHHPGVSVLHQLLDDRFDRVDAVEATSLVRRGRRWLIS